MGEELKQKKCNKCDKRKVYDSVGLCSLCNFKKMLEKRPTNN